MGNDGICSTDVIARAGGASCTDSKMFALPPALSLTSTMMVSDGWEIKEAAIPAASFDKHQRTEVEVCMLVTVSYISLYSNQPGKASHEIKCLLNPQHHHQLWPFSTYPTYSCKRKNQDYRGYMNRNDWSRVSPTMPLTSETARDAATESVA